MHVLILSVDKKVGSLWHAGMSRCFFQRLQVSTFFCRRDNQFRGMSAEMSEDSGSLQFDLPDCRVDFECVQSVPLRYVARGDLSAKSQHRLSESVKEQEESQERLEPLSLSVL